MHRIEITKRKFIHFISQINELLWRRLKPVVGKGGGGWNAITSKTPYIRIVCIVWYFKQHVSFRLWARQHSRIPGSLKFCGLAHILKETCHCGMVCTVLHGIYIWDIYDIFVYHNFSKAGILFTIIALFFMLSFLDKQQMCKVGTTIHMHNIIYWIILLLINRNTRHELLSVEFNT